MTAEGRLPNSKNHPKGEVLKYGDPVSSLGVHSVE